MKDLLIENAVQVRTLAFAPHSAYKVGAAVLGRDGNIYAGCNVENDSYGLSICAERNAIGAMVAGGCSGCIMIAVATVDGAPPCGACRQVLSQFAPTAESLAIYLVDGLGVVRETALDALFPDSFHL